jgi:hypothetical protein
MANDHRGGAADRIELALDLFDFGEEMFRQSLRRSELGITPADVDRRVAEWLRVRTGAAGGDGVGRVRSWNEIEGEARKGPS